MTTPESWVDLGELTDASPDYESSPNGGVVNSGDYKVTLTGRTVLAEDANKTIAIKGAGNPANAFDDENWLVAKVTAVDFTHNDLTLDTPAAVSLTNAAWELGTDNRKTIQDRINAGTGDETFLLPTGVWLITKSLRLDGDSVSEPLSGNRLVGVGRGSQLIMICGAGNTDDLIEIRTGSGFAVRDLRLTGNSDRGGRRVPFVESWVYNRLYNVPLLVSTTVAETEANPAGPDDIVWVLQNDVTNTNITDYGNDFPAWVTAHIYTADTSGALNRYEYDQTFDSQHGIYVNGGVSALTASLAPSTTSALTVEDVTLFPVSGSGQITFPSDSSTSKAIETFSWTGRSLGSQELTGLTRNTGGISGGPPTWAVGAMVQAAAPVTDVEISGVEIEQMVYGGIVAGSGPVNIALIGSGCENVRISDCYIHDCSAGIGGARRVGAIISGCTVEVTGNAVNVDQDGADNTIVGNVLGGTASAPARNGCSSYLSDDVTCTGNTFRHCHVGVSFSDTVQDGASRGGTISGNVFTDITNTCISVESSPNTAVDGNYGYSADETGAECFVKVSESANTVISGNTAYGAGTYGFQVVNCDGFVVSGNTARASEVAGFAFFGSSNGVVNGNASYDAGTSTSGSAITAGFLFGDPTAGSGAQMPCTNIAGSSNLAIDLRAPGDQYQKYDVYVVDDCVGIAILAPYQDSRALAEAPTTAIRETTRRDTATTSLTAEASGTIEKVAIWISSGDILTGIACLNGATAAHGLLHLFFGLYDTDSTNLLIETVDVGSAVPGQSGSWANQQLKTLAWSTNSTYRVPADGLYYIAICAIIDPAYPSPTLPTLRSPNATTDPIGLTPILHGTSTTSPTGSNPPLTAPPLPTPDAAITTVLPGRPYCFVY